MKKINIQKIVVPVDFSSTANKALDHAIFMAKLHQAELILVHVHETIMHTSALDYGDLPSIIDFEDSVNKKIDSKLSDLAHSIKLDNAVTTKVRTTTGRAYIRIIEIAEEEKADIIVMGTHGVSGFREFFLGSNTFRVVSDSPCPVLSIQESSDTESFKEIVLPIDDSSASRQKVGLAAYFAKHYNARVHVLGLITSEDEEYNHRMNLKLKQVVDYLSDAEVNHTVGKVSGSNLATLTQNYASSVNADLIVIMTEQESNLNFLMGPYAQQLVNHSKIPILSLRPEVNPDLLEYRLQ